AGDPWGPASGGHGRHHHGMSVSIHGDKIQIDGVKEMVADKLAEARRQIESNPQIPPDVRARVLERLERVNSVRERRLSRIRATDMDQLGEQLGKLGEELGQAMDGLGEDLAKIGDKIGKDVAKQVAKQLKAIKPHVDVDTSYQNNQGNSDSDSD